MNWKWYLTGLIVVLAFCGASMEQSKLDSNQEIVVQFNSHSISSADADKAVSGIIFQLKTLGVEDVLVSEVVEGKVTFTYYSAVEVGVIKNLLYSQNNLSLGSSPLEEENPSSDFPLDSNPAKYRLEVIKIQTDNGSDAGFHGVLVVSKYLGDQYLKPRLSMAVSEIHFNPLANFEILATHIYPHVPKLNNQCGHGIPEIRAGPMV